MSRRLLAAVGLLSLSSTSHALNSIDNLQQVTQPQFRLISEDLGAALSYKALTPAEPLGTTGFDIGIEVTDTQLQHADLFQLATGSSDNWDQLPLPKVHATKGLPFGIDIGAFYSSYSDIKLWGAEVKYAIVEGGVSMPAIALRGTYTKLSGIDQLDFDTRGVELGISKGFAMLTPYAGIGKVWATSTPRQEAVTIAGLTEEKFSLNKYYVGVNLNFGLFNMAAEGDKTGDATTYGLKVGLRF